MTAEKKKLTRYVGAYLDAPDWQRVKYIADERFFGNVSMALRYIIRHFGKEQPDVPRPE